MNGKRPSRRLARQIERAELRLRDAQYEQDVWGFGDKPSVTAAKKKRIAKCEERLARLLVQGR